MRSRLAGLEPDIAAGRVRLCFGSKKLWASPVGTAGCCPVSATARSRRTSSPMATGRVLKSYRSTRPTVPSSAVKFMERYGPERASGSGSGAGPTLAWLLRAHPTPVGLSRRQWRACRLHRTREETREARVDVLERGIGSTETGVCGAAPAGETQSVRAVWRAEARGVA